jgi:hypothetical protein
MSYSGYGALAAIGFVAVMGGVSMADRGMNYTAAKASVFRIDRSCSFTRTVTEPDGRQVATGIEQDCSATDEFRKIAAQEKRAMDIAGKAVVKVSYSDPKDGSYRTSELKFDGRDEQFYKLKAGDELPILVSNDDPARIRLD